MRNHMNYVDMVSTPVNAGPVCGTVACSLSKGQRSVPRETGVTTHSNIVEVNVTGARPSAPYALGGTANDLT